jgi:tetratricopeptide (TPR) repeat protein
VINLNVLESYTKALQEQPALSGLDHELWPTVMGAANQWGLLGLDSDMPHIVRLHPMLPYFLRTCLAASAQSEVRGAIESVFRTVYYGVGLDLFVHLESTDPVKRQAGVIHTELEYENLTYALRLCLATQNSVLLPFLALSAYLKIQHAEERGLELAGEVAEQLSRYPEHAYPRLMDGQLAGPVYEVASRLLGLNRYEEADAYYRASLDLLLAHPCSDTQEQKRKIASTYHQLGEVALQQRRWPEAERYYEEALVLKVELGDRHGQANTYHWLGQVAEAQGKLEEAETYVLQAVGIFGEFDDRHAQAHSYHALGSIALKQAKWPEAEQYYKQAMDIYVEFNDRHSQAGTYHQLGRLTEDQGHLAQAERLYQQALAIFIELGDSYAQAGSYYQLGRLVEVKEHLTEAIEYFLRALEIYVTFHDSKRYLLALWGLARIWLASDEAAIPAAASQILGCTIEVSKELLLKLRNVNPDKLRNEHAE